MYVCVCNAVTERQIGQAVREGAATLRDLRRELGVAAECGRCAACARDCLRSALGKQNQDTLAAAGAPAHMPASSLAMEAV